MDIITKTNRWLTPGRLLAICAALAAACAAHLALYAARYGLAVQYDSAIYLNSALNLLDGNGYSVNLTGGPPRPAVWFPPLYPLAMALFFKLLPDHKAALIALNAACMAASIGALALIARRQSGDKPLAALACVAVFSFSTVNLEIHTWAQSEPLFLAMTMLGLYFLSRAMDEGTTAPLVAGAACCALAVVTRYAGVALIGAAAAWLLLRRDRPARERVRRALVFLGVAVLPLAALMIRNRMVRGDFTGRPMTLFLINKEKLTQLVGTVAGVTVPGSDRFRVFPGQELAVFLVAAVLFALLLRLFARSRGAGAMKPSLGFFLFYAAAYMAMLAVLMTFVDSTLVFDLRLTSPALAALLVFCLGVLANAPIPHAALRKGIVAAACLLVFLYMGSYAVWTNYMANNGRGQNSRKYVSAEVNRFLASVIGSSTIYSNNIEGLYFLFERPIRNYGQLCDDPAEPGRPRYAVNLEMSDSLVLNAIAWSGSSGVPGCRPAEKVMQSGPVSVYKLD